ncbi:MAG: MBL fold metallo-hydrolase [Turicibacter sp.]|nr:MBL fold metallo-hydrolase [Turicibacter sp.]
MTENVKTLAIRGGEGGYLALTWDDSHTVLVDAGYPNDIAEIEKALNEAGVKLEEITDLFITHHDLDHLGCVPEIRQKSPNLRIYAHPDEAPYLDGRQLPIKVANMLERYDKMDKGSQEFCDFWQDFCKKNPIETQPVHDGQILDMCGGIEVIHVPGHTPGHIVLHLKTSDIIVCGDAANVKDGVLTGANPVYTNDIPQAAESFEKIKSYNAKGYITYHCGYLEAK